MSLDGLWPYFHIHRLFTWHDLCDWFGSDGFVPFLFHVSQLCCFSQNKYDWGAIACRCSDIGITSRLYCMRSFHLH